MGDVPSSRLIINLKQVLLEIRKLRLEIMGYYVRVVEESFDSLEAATDDGVGLVVGQSDGEDWEVLEAGLLGVAEKLGRGGFEGDYAWAGEGHVP